MSIVALALTTVGAFPVLHSCTVTGAEGSAVPYAVLMDTSRRVQTHDPDRILVQTPSMVESVTVRDRDIRIAVPVYVGQGPHGEVFIDPGDRGGSIQVRILASNRSQSIISIAHKRSPSIKSTFYKGRCSVTFGEDARAYFEAMQ